MSPAVHFIHEILRKCVVEFENEMKVLTQVSFSRRSIPPLLQHHMAASYQDGTAE